MTTFENQWNLFLERMALKEEYMPANQIKMMKQAFMGGIGIALILLRDEVPDNEEEAMRWFKKLMAEVNDYWQGEVGEKN